jgi:hypothetical protein
LNLLERDEIVTWKWKELERGVFLGDDGGALNCFLNQSKLAPGGLCSFFWITNGLVFGWALLVIYAYLSPQSPSFFFFFFFSFF